MCVCVYVCVCVCVWRVHGCLATGCVPGCPWPLVRGRLSPLTTFQRHFQSCGQASARRGVVLSCPHPPNPPHTHRYKAVLAWGLFGIRGAGRPEQVVGEVGGGEECGRPRARGGGH